MPLVAVLGSGIIGLKATEALVEAGYNVVVVSKDLPGDPVAASWASPSAGAVIYPTYTAKSTTREFETATFGHYWSLAHTDPSSGAQVIPVTEYFAEPYDPDSQAWYTKVKPYYRHSAPEELPLGIKDAVTVATVAVSPLIYLPYLRRNLEARGTKFSRLTAKSLDQVLRLTGAAVVVNASGHGAKELCNDAACTPVRGQAMWLRDRPRGWNKVLLCQDGGYTYVVPRLGTGGCLLGGVRQEGDEGDAADPALRRDILQRVNHLSGGAFKDVNLETDVDDVVAWRPGRDGGHRLEIQGPDVVHAYGFDGVGFAVSFGVGRRVVELVKQLTGGERARL
ncbi:uncharacterized protein PV06_07076 [Exophiala oligosperma]|uniref:FAD dependent oxidoreductase domain-containing protein n=1 Tax=Exophiala oligosperma TaxID=215243 RepID=A0A0D2ANP2_9EURO|nr:uncharacterized protein PV06_07076 [Exophiala oligosperma]KIW41526.1 hypothetical protein PV06_07076 [Exophiala oligosperma]